MIWLLSIGFYVVCFLQNLDRLLKKNPETFLQYSMVIITTLPKRLVIEYLL